MARGNNNNNNNNNNDVELPPPPPLPTGINKFSLRSVLEKDKLTGENFLDWEKNLRIVLRMERVWYVLEAPQGDPPAASAGAEALRAYTKHTEDAMDVACLMLATMSSELQTNLMDVGAYEMYQQLKEMFQAQARIERYNINRTLNSCKMVEGSSVSAHVLKMKGYLDHLARLGSPVSHEMAIDLILNSLSKDFKQFVTDFNMHNMDKSVTELHIMLKTAEESMGLKSVENKGKEILMVREGGVRKKKGKRERLERTSASNAKRLAIGRGIVPSTSRR